jgi:hypothetical protein
MKMKDSYQFQALLEMLNLRVLFPEVCLNTGIHDED